MLHRKHRSIKEIKRKDLRHDIFLHERDARAARVREISTQINSVVIPFP